MRIAVMLAFEGGLGLLALALGAMTGISPLATLRFEPSDIVIGAVATAPMLALFGAVWIGRVRFFARIRERVEDAIVELFARASLGQVAAVAAAAGFGEEALFRGFLQGGLEQWIGRWSALLAVSVAFGLVHPITAGYAVLAALLGVYLGSLWIVTGNLLVPVVAHGLYDFIALLVIVKHGSGTRASTALCAGSVVLGGLVRIRRCGGGYPLK